MGGDSEALAARSDNVCVACADGLEMLVAPDSVAVDPEGNIFVHDRAQGILLAWRFDGSYAGVVAQSSDQVHVAGWTRGRGGESGCGGQGGAHTQGSTDLARWGEHSWPWRARRKSLDDVTTEHACEEEEILLRYRVCGVTIDPASGLPLVAHAVLFNRRRCVSACTGAVEEAVEEAKREMGAGGVPYGG